MKKYFILTTGIAVLLSLVSFSNTKENRKVDASTPSYLVTNYLYKDDKVMFTTLSCSPSAITGGILMEKDVSKGYTVKGVEYSTPTPVSSSNSLFTVVEGYQSGTVAFKLGEQYLRADTSTLKFKETTKYIEADKTGNVYTFAYPMTVEGISFNLNFSITDNGEEDYEVIGYSDYTVTNLTAQVLSEDAIMMDGTILFDMYYYMAKDEWAEHKLENQEITYHFDGGVLLVDDPTAVSETVDKEASWIYTYDKDSQTSTIQSCLNSKYIYYDTEASKFKMQTAVSGLDLFVDTSINTAKHKPSSISLDTTNVPESCYVGESIQWTSLLVNSTYSGGVSSNIPLGGYSISFDKDTSSVGTVTATVDVYGLTKTFTVEVKEKPAGEVKLKGMTFANYKTQYYVGEAFNYDVDITIQYENKADHLLTKEEKEERVTIQAPNMSKTGHQRAAQVAYWEIIDDKKQELKIGQGFNYYVDIVEPPFVFDKLQATVKSDYTYYDDSKFTSAGVKIEAVYKVEGFSDKLEDVTSSCTFSVTGFTQEQILTEGVHEVTANYKNTAKSIDSSVKFNITVNHKPVATGYEITAEDGFVGTAYDYQNKVIVKQTFDVGEPRVITGWNINVNDLNSIKNSTMPKTQTIRIELNSKVIGSKDINLTFAPVSSFSLRYTSSKSDAEVGDTQQLAIKNVNSEPTLDITDFNPSVSNRGAAYLDRFTYSSNNESVATVTSTGLVTYTGEGTASITVTPKQGDATPQVYSVQIGVVTPTSVSLDKTSGTLKEGETLQLNATVLPMDAEDKSVTWSSDNNNVATVSNTGLVTAIKKGTCNIKVKTNVGEFEATCVINVNERIKVTSISLNMSELILTKGNSFKLIASVYPNNAENKNVIWETTDSSIASVSQEGMVIGINPGTCKILVKSQEDNSIKAECVVTVNEPQNSGGCGGSLLVGSTLICLTSILGTVLLFRKKKEQ